MGPLQHLLRRSAAIGALLASACAYGFSGGGLPSHVRTVAVLPFSNETASPDLTREVTDAVREGLSKRLGLRDASEEVLPIRALGRLFGAMLFPTMTFVISRFGEQVILPLLRR